MQHLQECVCALKAKQIHFDLDEPMKNHTTFHIGGPASIYCEPQDTRQLVEILGICNEIDIPVFFLGLGSNVVFSDAGFDGLVLCLSKALGQLTVEGTQVVAGAGLALKEVCKQAGDAGLSGLEFAYGIPGSIGGAVYMDAGAFDGEMRHVLKEVTFLDENLEVVTLPVDQLQMDYRTSIFQFHTWCILSATFDLHLGDKETIWEKMQDLMDRRTSKQPLDMPSAGSAFKRPQGAYAAALIDQCGLRGYQIGDAAISEKHCGFIVNLGNASCQDVMQLADYVVMTVKEKTGFVLEKEMQVVT